MHRIYIRSYADTDAEREERPTTNFLDVQVTDLDSLEVEYAELNCRPLDVVLAAALCGGREALRAAIECAIGARSAAE